jgi:hypothetical protein
MRRPHPVTAKDRAEKWRFNALIGDLAMILNLYVMTW